MTFKRKPPDYNVRRVTSRGGNIRYAITSKAQSTVQCESFHERKLTLRFDRDPTVQAYTSQPERFSFRDPQGKSHTYVPDFLVWKSDGEVEIHEVTLTARRDKHSIQAREAAAHAICLERGWRYIVHTEQSLPQATEEANLLALYRYRPTAYANAEVTRSARERLAHGERMALRALIAQIMHQLSLPHPVVISALCHLLWHGSIEADLCRQLLFQDAAPAAQVVVWLLTGEQAP